MQGFKLRRNVNDNDFKVARDEKTLKEKLKNDYNVSNLELEDIIDWARSAKKGDYFIARRIVVTYEPYVEERKGD